MTEWLSAVWSRTKVAFSREMIGPDKDTWVVWAPLSVIGMILSAFFFAIYDYGRVNIVVSFVAGFFTGGIFILFSYGSIVLWLFLSVFFSFLPGKFMPTSRCQIISAVAAGVVVIIAWIATLEVLKGVPILGDQITFMFRDKDD